MDARSRFDTSVYALDRAGGGSLTEQLADNIRRAVADGVYRAGDTLPGIREMAKLCSTSVQVPIDALKALAAEGIVKSRPRIGTVVLGESRLTWRGRVLVVNVGAFTNYSQNVFCFEVSRQLAAANWRVESVFVPRTGRGDDMYDLDMLEKLISEPFDLVLLPADDPPVVRMVQRRGLPCMLLAAQVGMRCTGCIGILIRTYRRAFADFAAHCRSEGIRRILCVAADISSPREISALREAGISVEDLLVSPDISERSVTSFAQCAYDAMSSRLGCGRRPDLVFFCDDYLARGGLLAMERLGIRVPEDMKVVSLVNYGNEPFYPKALTRFEVNPFAEAKSLVRLVLRWFDKGRTPKSVFCNVRYVRGETF